MILVKIRNAQEAIHKALRLILTQVGKLTAQAMKHVLMSALTYNLKKYLKFKQRKLTSNAMALQRELCLFEKTILEDSFKQQISPSNFYKFL